MSEADYDAVWQAIRDGHLASFYIWEAYWLADSIVGGCDEVLEKTPPIGEFINVDPELFQTIGAVVGAAARLRALLVERQRTKRQSALEHALQIRRARWLASDLLRDLEFTEITKAAVRHSLEHFDEYLDRQGLKWLRGQIAARDGVPMDMMLSSRQVLKSMLNGAEMTLVRVYVAQERRFVNSEDEVDISALREEGIAVRDRLQPLANPGTEPAEKRGSFLTFLGPAPKLRLPD